MARPINILLIDDDKDEHIFFQEALNKITSFAHNLQSKFDGQEAVNFLQLKDDDRKSPLPDIIFLDLNMPRMDGFATLKMLKADPKFKNTPIYIFTNSHNLDDVRITNNLGSFGFFTKSVN